jgi:hypothetical protein
MDDLLWRIEALSSGRITDDPRYSLINGELLNFGSFGGCSRRQAKSPSLPPRRPGRRKLNCVKLCLLRFYGMRSGDFTGGGGSSA